MGSVALRQSGGAIIVSIPKAITKALGLNIGSKLDLSIQDEKIVLTPEAEDMTLETLLSASPKECFALTEEDREWESTSPVGKEV